MTERFVAYFDKDHNYIIQDLVNEDEYQVGFVNCDEDVFLELINQLNDENEQLKQALREQLEENGNAYCIKILDKIFDLKYDEWQRKMNETHTYDYIDWEKVLKDKGDVE